MSHDTDSPVAIDVSDAIAPFADRLRTRRIVLRTGLLDQVHAHVHDLLPEGTWAVVDDATVAAIAGDAVAAGLEAAGVHVTRWCIEPGEGETAPVADEAKVELLRAWLVAEAPAAVVAVGAGTINDVAKMACFKASVPYAIVGTAPSMNGYTSSIAAILTNGVKTTQPCDAPLVCLADLDVMAEAPYRMIASGLGDLISKPVSNADWRLSHRLLGAPYADGVMVLVDHAAALLDGIAPALPQRDREAVGKLTASLCLSGLAMSVAGSSAPASGGEHLISHYIDMTHFAFGDPHDFHGCQVGVGTITSAALYARLADLDPATIDVEARAAAWPTWEARASDVAAHFGPLAPAVLPHTKAAHPTADQLRDRLTRLKTDWDDIIADVGRTLRTPASIRDELNDADCPLTFDDIGVVPDRAIASIVHGKDIRARYTILHLADELGLLEAWAQEVYDRWHAAPKA